MFGIFFSFRLSAFFSAVVSLLPFSTFVCIALLFSPLHFAKYKHRCLHAISYALNAPVCVFERAIDFSASSIQTKTCTQAAKRCMALLASTIDYSLIARLFLSLSLSTSLILFLFALISHPSNHLLLYIRFIFLSFLSSLCCSFCSLIFEVFFSCPQLGLLCAVCSMLSAAKFIIDETEYWRFQVLPGIDKIFLRSHNNNNNTAAALLL